GGARHYLDLRNHVRRQPFDLRLERRLDVAVRIQRLGCNLRQLRANLAAVVDSAAGARPALERQAVADARGEIDLDAVPHLTLRAVVARARNEVVGLPGFLRLDVVELRDRLSAAIRQSAVDWCCHAERVEVARRDREIVGDGEVAEYAMEVAD